MAEPDPFPTTPSRLFIIGIGFDPKFTKYEPYIGAGYEYDHRDWHRTWRANRFVPSPGPITWENVAYPDPTPLYEMRQTGSPGNTVNQQPRYGAFMVHGHYDYIDEQTSVNPFYPLHLNTAHDGMRSFRLIFVTDGEPSQTIAYLQYRAIDPNGAHNSSPESLSPNMDDVYGRDVLIGSLEGAMVTVYLDGQTIDVGLESSAYKYAQGSYGQFVSDVTGKDVNKCFVKKITGRDGHPVGSEIEWLDPYGNPL